MKLEVFDPPMCGPDVDPQLVQFAADLEWLKAKGVEVVRSNLTQQPDAFVLNALLEKGVKKLPFFLVNGRLVGTGLYPSRNQLAQVIDLSADSSAEKLLSGSSCCGPTNCCS